MAENCEEDNVPILFLWGVALICLLYGTILKGEVEKLRKMVRLCLHLRLRPSRQR